MQEFNKLNDIELSSMIVGAACHDYEHFGLTNQFLVETKNHLATKYNDDTVLENHHSAASYAVTTSNPHLDIYKDMDSDDFKSMRKTIIDLILSTDMMRHPNDFSKFNQRRVADDFDPEGDDK